LKEEVREKVYKHLANSSLHQVAEDVAKAAAASVQIEEVVWTASEMDAWEKTNLEKEKTKMEKKNTRRKFTMSAMRRGRRKLSELPHRFCD